MCSTVVRCLYNGWGDPPLTPPNRSNPPDTIQLLQYHWLYSPFSSSSLWAELQSHHRGACEQDGRNDCIYLFKKIIFIYLFLERGREGEREGEKHQCVRETSIDRMPLACPQPGTWPRPLACALTGNEIGNLFLICRTTPPNPLSQTSQGWLIFNIRGKAFSHSPLK